jgi:hypothetical protein
MLESPADWKEFSENTAWWLAKEGAMTVFY